MSSVWFNPTNHTVYSTNTSTVDPADYKMLYCKNTSSLSAGDNHPIYINGSNTPFMYVPEEPTRAVTAQTLNFKLDKDEGHMSFARGPMRTHVAYGTAANNCGIRWHIDDNVTDGRVYAFDNGTLNVVDQKTIDKANKKSMKLLKEWLSAAEYKYLMEEGNLELPSQHEKDTIYIVNKDPMKRIGIKKKGKVVEKSLCIHASHSYPTGDILLANIMLLKTDEKKFLEIANVHDFYA